MKLLHRFLVLLLSFSLLLLPLTQAQAAIVTNGQLMYDMQQLNDKELILQSINRADVQEQLADMGVSTAELEERINQMTGEEIAQLNQQLNELPAGSGVLGIIVLVFVVFVITDVIGATNIFPFIHPVK